MCGRGLGGWLEGGRAVEEERDGQGEVKGLRGEMWKLGRSPFENFPVSLQNGQSNPDESLKDHS